MGRYRQTITVSLTIIEDGAYFIIHKEDSKQREYEIFLKEKQMIDEIVAKIHEEDQKATQEKIQAQLHRRSSLDKYLQEREEWKRQEKARMEEEDRKIREYPNHPSNQELLEINAKFISRHYNYCHNKDNFIKIRSNKARDYTEVANRKEDQARGKG
jgi:hypothetical protein